MYKNADRKPRKTMHWIVAFLTLVLVIVSQTAFA